MCKTGEFISGAAYFYHRVIAAIVSSRLLDFALSLSGSGGEGRLHPWTGRQFAGICEQHYKYNNILQL